MNSTAQLILMLLLVILLFFILGVIAFFRWLFRSSAPAPSEAPFSPNPPPIEASSAQPIFNKERFRIFLDDLYFSNELSLGAKSKIMSFLSIDQSPSEGGKTSIEIPEKPILRKTLDSATEMNMPPPSPKVAPISQPVYQPAYSSAYKAPASSGFFRSDNIKTMLISGACLFVFSAYLFVRSYWTIIPDFIKFAALAGTTGLIHFLGFALFKKKRIPKTAETLLGLSVLLIPFNFFAANRLILNSSYSADGVWALGLLAMAIGGLWVSNLLPSFGFGVLTGIGISASFYFWPEAFKAPDQMHILIFLLANLIWLSIIYFYAKNPDWKFGNRTVVNISVLLALLALSINGFYLHSENHIVAAMSLCLVGVIAAIQSRFDNHNFAYGAGLSFFASLGILLHHFQVPLYKFGFAYIPAGFLALWRAKSFEQQKRQELGHPYHHLGHVAIAGSVLAILPSFQFYVTDGFASLMSVLILSTIAYSILALTTRNAVFTLATGLVLLFTVFSAAWHSQCTFGVGLLLMTVASFLLMGIGILSGKSNGNTIGQPLTHLSLLSMTVLICLGAGRWGAQLLDSGSISLNIPESQLPATLAVSAMGCFSYILMAWLRRQAALLYPALGSATLVYCLVLEWMGAPISLLNMSFVVAVTVIGMLILDEMGKQKAARAFGIWTDILFIGIAFGSLVQFNSGNWLPLVVCGTAFLPGVWRGDADLTVGFLSSLYLGHILWFSNAFTFQDESMFLYAGHLLLINCGVILLTTLLALKKKNISVLSFQFFVGIFSVVSLISALNDRMDSWQIFFAYGLVTFVVSHIHYNKKFHVLGAGLWVAAYELFLMGQRVELSEAYTLPIMIYLLVCGYIVRNNKSMRDFLYSAGQLVFYVPTLAKALTETGDAHGIFLGVVALALLLIGINYRSKSLTMISLIFLLTNGFVQSFHILKSIPRWIYLGVGGLTLVGLGGLFEFQRENLRAFKNNVVESFERWD